MKTVLQLALFVFILQLTNCKTKNIASDNDDIIIKTSKTIVSKKLNPDKTLVLVLKYEDNLELVKTFLITVKNVENDSVIYNDKFIGINIEWLDNDKLKAYLPVGNIEKQSDEIDEHTNPTSDNYKIIEIKK